jgi:hypothetical protein
VMACKTPPRPAAQPDTSATPPGRSAIGSLYLYLGHPRPFRRRRSLQQRGRGPPVWGAFTSLARVGLVTSAFPPNVERLPTSSPAKKS